MKNSKKLSNNSGQAITEYLLLLFLALGVVYFLNLTIKETLGKYWVSIANKIVSSCPTCADESLTIPGLEPSN